MLSVRPDRKNKKVNIAIDKAIPRVRWQLRLALTLVVKENSAHNKKLIKNAPKTGRNYRFQGRQHQASKGGEAPADRSGDLRKTAGFRVYGHTRAEFGDRMLYGKFLEGGTKKMRKRPHIVRTVREKERDNFVTLANTVHKGMVAL